LAECALLWTTAPIAVVTIYGELAGVLVGGAQRLSGVPRTTP
jgi:hypothetical protein